jgi:3-hydroxypropanoate dehydrogenase
MSQNAEFPQTDDAAMAARKAAAELREHAGPLSPEALTQLFLGARSHNGWLPRAVPPELLHRLYALLRMAPTSMNCAPARFVFLCSDAAREQLRPALLPGNVDKMMSAPVVAIIGHDEHFHERLPQLFPHRDARPMFNGNPALASITAFRNGTLQGAWLMMAARSLGLDCGPVSGFDHATLDAAFFEGTQIRSNFLCALGYGDSAKLFQRLPRLAFDEACQIL